ncbi:hypothetical protein [Wolbachia endosymbiont of Atemnus politus]|nr:hypothetical protein [Wolbachia endosymbiont of Atemnus politus]
MGVTLVSYFLSSQCPSPVIPVRDTGIYGRFSYIIPPPRLSHKH